MSENREWRHGAVWRLLALCALGLAMFALPALASNSDVHSPGLGTGLGDGANSNYYVHPYFDTFPEGYQGAHGTVTTRRATGPQGAATGWKHISNVDCFYCAGGHWHDTSSVVTNTEAAECRYYDVNHYFFVGWCCGTAYNYHSHPHHYFCG